MDTSPSPGTGNPRGPRGDCYFRDKSLPAGQGHGWEGHDHAVLTLVLRGRLDETFSRREQRCSVWELHYKPRGAVHSTSTGPEGVRMFLVGLRNPPREDLEPRAAGRPRLLGGGTRAARALAGFLRIQQDLRRRATADRETLRSLWATLASGPTGGCAAAGKPPVWITEVRDRILAGAGARARLSRLAAEFRVHPVYLARVFRKSYGRSIDEVRRRARADQAVERLVREETPLSEMALDLGYADQSHFTREFRRETGWTPGGFRNEALFLTRAASQR